MIDLLKNKASYRTIIVKKKKELTLRSDYIYYLRSGATLLEQPFQNEEKNYTLIAPNKFFPVPIIDQTLSVLALDNAKIIIFNKEKLFDTLEKDDILSNFTWYLAKEAYKMLRANLLQNNLDTKMRLLCILKEISELYPVEDGNSSASFLPSWLKTKYLSLLCHCSLRAINYNLKKLEEEQILVFNNSKKTINLEKLTDL